MTRCACEHARHFADDLDGNPKPIEGHAYGAERADAKPADVSFMVGELFCDECREVCHGGARILGWPHGSGLTTEQNERTAYAVELACKRIDGLGGAS